MNVGSLSLVLSQGLRFPSRSVETYTRPPTEGFRLSSANCPMPKRWVSQSSAGFLINRPEKGVHGDSGDNWDTHDPDNWDTHNQIGLRWNRDIESA